MHVMDFQRQCVFILVEMRNKTNMSFHAAPEAFINGVFHFHRTEIPVHRVKTKGEKAWEIIGLKAS